MDPRCPLPTDPLEAKQDTSRKAATRMETAQCWCVFFLFFFTPRQTFKRTCAKAPHHLHGRLRQPIYVKTLAWAPLRWWTHRVLLDVIAGRQVGVPEQRGRPAGNLHWCDRQGEEGGREGGALMPAKDDEHQRCSLQSLREALGTLK